MKNRVCIIVLDSVGIGEMPDAAEFGDVGTHTLGNISKQQGKLNLPNLYAMGLGNIENSQLPKVDKPTAAYGKMAEKTKAKDTTSGHWELAGIIMDEPFRTFANFPQNIMDKWLKSANLAGFLGNKAASGTAIIDELGEEHMKTGLPIVYTSADSVFQVAAHEEIISIQDLYRICEVARKLLVDDYQVGRVIARPFVGEPGNFSRTKNRKDYAVEPISDTILDALVANGQNVLGIGKIEDIFCKRGITHINHTTNNADGISATIQALKSQADDLIFTNLVDFDMLYGHRNNVAGYAAALEYFDERLPQILAAMQPTDTLYITADHGCDPTYTQSTDHSREYVPILVYGKNVVPQNLGVRATFADLAADVYFRLTGKNWEIGEKFF